MRILSIQSHVAYGYVGNRAAAFPLQRLGHDVWAVNTVEFSNHTGYGRWRGRVVDAAQVREVVAGVEELGVLPRCDALLTGYLGSAEIGAAVLDVAATVRAANPRVAWCADPVMGDVGRGVFVRPGIVEFMRDALVPAADVVTPNHFEVELLTGATVATLEDAIAAARSLLRKPGSERGPRVALVTSLRRADAPSGRIEMLAATADAAWLVSTPLIAFEVPPNGTGDLVAALFLARWLPREDAAAALEAAAGGVYAVLKRTAAAGERELALVAAQDEFAAPAERFASRKVA